MIKQVYQVQVKDRFGYADTLEQAKELEDTFKTSFGGVQGKVAVSSLIEDTYYLVIKK